jgi:hypothetical protein
MVFTDVVAVLERTFQTELAVVQDTTVFEVAGGDGAARVRVLVQDEAEHGLVLLSADLGEPPPEGRERLFQTMLEANNLFSGTAGATLALDAASGECRLQAFLVPDELANDVEGRLVPFLETALDWRRAIEDFRASGGGEAEPGGGFGMLPV